jgi:hypothetical protein
MRVRRAPGSIPAWRVSGYADRRDPGSGSLSFHSALLRSITAEQLADSAWARRLGWRGDVEGVQLVTHARMCAVAAVALDRSVTPTRTDSVAFVRAGNRYTTLRTGQVDAVLMLDENGRKLEPSGLE